MIVFSSFNTSIKSDLCLKDFLEPLSSNKCTVLSCGNSRSCYIYFISRDSESKHACLSDHATSSSSLSVRSNKLQGGSIRTCFSIPLISSKRPRKQHLKFSLDCQSMRTILVVPRQNVHTRSKCSMVPKQVFVSMGLIVGLLVCYSSSKPVHSSEQNEDGEDKCVKFSHGKKVYTEYSIIGIPGDGRCMFRSVAHGACVRSGTPAPGESIQRQLADELRAKVADEFVKRREETEWFIEGDFDTYVSHIRESHVWGGEPELFMASHVLQMPITVYMHDKEAGGLISIAEYGQEYGKDVPIRVLYHGFGHYDALEIPGKKMSLNSRL